MMPVTFDVSGSFVSVRERTEVEVGAEMWLVGGREIVGRQIIIPRRRQRQLVQEIAGWRRKNCQLPHEGVCVVFLTATFLAFRVARCWHCSLLLFSGISLLCG